ncbi:hypothetical protein [Mangrovibacterium sp.]|uniref:hypothetical protein n=1 Tax=Mangrovibacterium sp. TaxID=1961364 RepID=UPI003564FAB5
MKAKFKTILFLLTLVSYTVHAGQFDRKIHKSYLSSQITALEVSNKFGLVEINNLGGDSVTVDVVITMESPSEEHAQQMMNLISINIKRSGSILKAQTIIDNDFKSKENFSIIYKINIPGDRNLTVDNKFGDVAVQSLAAAGNFDISYGNLTAGELNAPGTDGISLALDYGKADIKAVNKLKGVVKYSKVFIGQAENLSLETMYSGLNIDEVKTMNLESKYDEIKLGRAAAIVAESKYTNYKLDEVTKSLTIKPAYGSVKVSRVSPEFEKIEITNNYGSVALGMDTLSYQLQADCEYCDLKYPAENFQGDHLNDKAQLKVLGTVGQPGTTRKVVITSRYGGIDLTN